MARVGTIWQAAQTNTGDFPPGAPRIYLMNDRVLSAENESSRMIGGKTRRPRNVDSLRAAAILYGDWGTSKAYVLGLAFALAGYRSFWLIAAMSFLLALVGINHMALCR